MSLNLALLFSTSCPCPHTLKCGTERQREGYYVAHPACPEKSGEIQKSNFKIVQLRASKTFELSRQSSRVCPQSASTNRLCHGVRVLVCGRTLQPGGRRSVP